MCILIKENFDDDKKFIFTIDFMCQIQILQLIMLKLLEFKVCFRFLVQSSCFFLISQIPGFFA